jgi:hypothetical protein
LADSEKNSLSNDFKFMLDKIGLEENRWYETIVTTFGPHINAAAIGVRRIDDKFKMKIFEMSNTFDNLNGKGKIEEPCRFAINIMDNSQIELLCYAALKGWGSPIPEFPQDYYEKVENAPVFREANAWIICEPFESKLEEIKDSYGKSTRMNLTAGIVKIILNNNSGFKPITRGPDEPLIDAIVYATKFKIAKGAMKDKCRSRVEKILENTVGQNDVGHTLTIEALKEFFGILD